VIPIETIEESNRDCEYSLADIGLDNPNVWYEVGHAFAIGKDAADQGHGTTHVRLCPSVRRLRATCAKILEKVARSKKIRRQSGAGDQNFAL
jgi:hypothetical protein